ncbi:MAG TPA: hypothetical protein VGA80_12450 [Flavobacteriaceae bacterium]
MKKILIIVTALTLASCGQSKEEKLISDYVQTFGDSKIDANFKMKNLEKLNDITAKDSLEILKSYFEEKKNNKISQFQESIDSNKERLDKYTKDLAETNPNNTSIVELYQKYIDEAKSEIERNEKNIELYQTDCKGTFLEPVLIAITDYEKQGDKVLYTKYKASYSVNNPMLNNTKQEFEREFYINADKTNVVKASE